jgi:hypothetical protein
MIRINASPHDVAEFFIRCTTFGPARLIGSQVAGQEGTEQRCAASQVSGLLEVTGFCPFLTLWRGVYITVLASASRLRPRRRADQSSKHVFESPGQKA